MTGKQVKILPGALPTDGAAPRLLAEHDSRRIVGMVTERQQVDDVGVMFTAEIARTAEGNDIVELLKMGAYDSVSIGIEPVDVEHDEGVTIVKAANWKELSIVSEPAFKQAVITEIAATAVAEPDDNETPTPNEDNNMTEEQPELVEAAAETVPTAPIVYAQPKKHFDMPSASEYLAAYHVGGEVFEKVNNAFVEAAKSKQTALQAAAGDVLTTDTPGLLPVPIVAPVFDDFNYTRPVVAAVGARAMPDGGNSKTFIRPTWTTHTSVDAQSSELSAVSATTPVIASNVIQKSTLSGQVTLSVQDIDFTSPAALQIILADLANEYLDK